jgi:hypothetical protein
MSLREIGYSNINWVEVAQDWVQLWASVVAVMNVWFYNNEVFLATIDYTVK